MEIGTSAVVKEFSKLQDAYAFILNTGKVVFIEVSNLVGKPSANKLLYGTCKLFRNTETKYTLNC